MFGKNRDRLSIFAAILEAANSGASKTRIMYTANLSFKLLEKYLASVLGLGFLQVSDSCYYLTDDGKEFLRRYKHFHEQVVKAKSLLMDIDREKKQLLRLSGLPLLEHNVVSIAL